MRGLASYVMSGRYRGLLVAVASSGSLLFAWISAAVVALVTLRKGVQQGLWLLPWALLPALVLTQITGDSTTLALLLGTSVLAVVLRATVSLPLAAVASALVAVLTGLAMLAFGQGLLDELMRVFGEFFRALAEQAQREGSELALQPPTRLQLAGMMGLANGTLSFLCLALGRYWQAALYNPGGFGEEFRALRYPPTLVIALLVGALAVGATGVSYRSWAATLLLPLTIAGFALLHARARFRGQGSFWLGTVYLLWTVIDAAKLALVGLVVADALLDFRRRWKGDDKSGPGGGAADGDAHSDRGLDTDRDSAPRVEDTDNDDPDTDGPSGDAR